MKILQIVLTAALLTLMSQPLLGVPTLQAYIDGGTAQSLGPDEQSWFTNNSTFDLIVVGSYQADGGQGQKQTQNLTEVTILVSVPQGQTGTISISGGDVGATLLTEPRSIADGFWNPPDYADVDVLTDLSGDDGYSTKDFLPDIASTAKEEVKFNNHYPFKEGISYFLIYGIGDFDNEGSINNYNADDGTITYDAGVGEEKTFTVNVAGFDWVHFDTYGYESYLDGKNEKQATWNISIGSHDSTYNIPAPGAILLASIGAGLVGWLRRRKAL